MIVLWRFPNEGCDFGNGGGAVCVGLSGIIQVFKSGYGVNFKIFHTDLPQIDILPVS
jgi:hypothetical protein